ncbi:MAG: hypothetical protein ACLR2E_21445 [Lachnospiraceae bacterium]
MDLKYEEYAKTFERIFSGDWREEDKTDDSLNTNDMNNTSIADYVWLPSASTATKFTSTGWTSGASKITNKKM